MDPPRTQPGDPDIVIHDKETDIEPALRNLVGKKLSDSETTSTACLSPTLYPPSTFAKEDLPPGTRVIQAPGKWATTEHAPSRLTVVVGDDGTISHVFTG